MQAPRYQAPRYNEAVRRLFTAPAHAGDTSGIMADVARGGARVVLTADLDESRIVRMRFRVLGCPHLVAAAEAACAGLEGQPAEVLREFSIGDIMGILEIPVEKTGLMLLLEDAIRALGQQITANDSNRS